MTYGEVSGHFGEGVTGYAVRDLEVGVGLGLEEVGALLDGGAEGEGGGEEGEEGELGEVHLEVSFWYLWRGLL